MNQASGYVEYKTQQPKNQEYCDNRSQQRHSPSPPKQSYPDRTPFTLFAARRAAHPLRYVVGYGKSCTPEVPPMYRFSALRCLRPQIKIPGRFAGDVRQPAFKSRRAVFRAGQTLDHCAAANHQPAKGSSSRDLAVSAGAVRSLAADSSYSPQCRFSIGCRYSFRFRLS